MRIAFISLFLILATSTSTAQDRVKTWIFLADKVDQNGKHTVVEPDHLTPRAAERMQIRGDALKASQIATQDAPVAKHYIASLSDMGLQLAHTSRWLNAVSAWLTEEEIAAVDSLPFVTRTQPVARMSTMITPYHPAPLAVARRINRSCPDNNYGASCTQLDVVNAIPALRRGINGSGVHLGFLDTKYGPASPFEHPTFSAMVADGRVGGHQDFTNRDATQLCSSQTSLHGQYVVSVAAGYSPGRLVGPAHGATIWGAVTECVLYERNIEEDNLVVGAEWLTNQGVDIISVSLGYTDFDAGQNSYSISDLDGDTGITTRILDWATARGVVTVTSAGNSGLELDWPYISTPADGDSVIAAGGVLGNRYRWPESSIGPTADGRIKPDVSAQSSGVYFATGSASYGQGRGTSFSAPMIAGVVAQILQVNSALRPRAVWDVLTSTASQSNSPDNLLGWGIVDAEAAIQLAARRVGTERAPVSVDQLVAVHAPFPNPFTNSAKISVELAQGANEARLSIYNIIGQEVAQPWNGRLSAGHHDIQVESHSFPPGLYVYVFETEHSRTSGTMVLVR